MQGYVSLFPFHNAEDLLTGSSPLAGGCPRIQLAQDVPGAHGQRTGSTGRRDKGERIALESQDKPVVLMKIVIVFVALGLVLHHPIGLCKMYRNGMCGRLDCKEFSSF